MISDEDKDSRVADYLQTPWLRKRLAKAMVSKKPVMPPPLSRTERRVATVYVAINRVITRIERRINSWLIRVLIGIDNRRIP